jgi:surface-adhesin protein E
MTRLLLITLLVLSSGPAYAEWVPLVEQKEAGITVYADPDTIRRNGDVVELWALMDFKTTQTEPKPPHMSVKSQHEFDCAEERSRQLAVTAFSGNMGSGKGVYSNSDEQKWEPVAPQSFNQALWKFACGKK